MVMKLALAGLIGVGCWVSGMPSTLEEYLKLRKQYGITHPTTAFALETLQGKGILEVQAVIKGVVRGDTVSILLEAAGSRGISLPAPPSEAWLLVPGTRARLLVEAERKGAGSPLVGKVLSACPEQEIAKWEERIRRAEEEKKKQELARQASRQKAPPPPSSRGSTWTLSPQEALPYYGDFIASYNRRLTREQAYRIAHGIIGYSLQYGVDARLILAMVLVESGFNPSATSPKGAQGLGQLMPSTAQGLGVRNAYDIYENLYGTVRLIRGHLDKYKVKAPDGQEYADLVLALAAYNAGSGAVSRHRGVPPYRETQNYIQKVISLYLRFCGKT